MSMTEEEAGMKVCCGPPQTINGREPLLKCIGSTCMAWRWDRLPITIVDGEPVWAGYCGLAGETVDRRGGSQ